MSCEIKERQVVRLEGAQKLRPALAEIGKRHVGGARHLKLRGAQHLFQGRGIFDSCPERLPYILLVVGIECGDERPALRMALTGRQQA